MKLVTLPVMHNPFRSLAWESVASLKKLEEPGRHLAELDQCHFGLRGPRGGLRKKFEHGSSLPQRWWFL